MVERLYVWVRSWLPGTTRSPSTLGGLALRLQSSGEGGVTLPVIQAISNSPFIVARIVAQFDQQLNTKTPRVEVIIDKTPVRFQPRSSLSVTPATPSAATPLANQTASVGSPSRTSACLPNRVDQSSEGTGWNLAAHPLAEASCGYARAYTPMAAV